MGSWFPFNYRDIAGWKSGSKCLSDIFEVSSRGEVFFFNQNVALNSRQQAMRPPSSLTPPSLRLFSWTPTNRDHVPCLCFPTTLKSVDIMSFERWAKPVITQNVIQATINQLLQFGGIEQSSKKMMEADPDFLMGKVFLLVSEIVSWTYMSPS